MNTYLYQFADISIKHRLDHQDEVNWAVLVRYMLSELGFYDVWLQQRMESYNVFISLFKQMLIDNYVQSLNAPGQTHRELFFLKCVWLFPIS